jgi:hypothetical protein
MSSRRIVYSLLGLLHLVAGGNEPKSPRMSRPLRVAKVDASSCGLLVLVFSCCRGFSSIVVVFFVEFVETAH